MGGPPRSGMVVCRPLRSSRPETPGTPQCRPRHSRFMQTKHSTLFWILMFSSALHFPDSGMGRYSRVWNGGFQAFAARPAGNPLAPKCRPCHLTTPYSPSNHYVLLTTHTSWLPRWRRPPRSGMAVRRPLRSSLPETPGAPQCRPRRQDTPILFLPDSDGEALQGMEWCFPGLYGAACRKPLAPPTPATLRFPSD